MQRIYINLDVKGHNMKIIKKGEFGKGEVVEYIADTSDDIEIENKDRHSICTGVYSIKNQDLFERDKKILVVIEFPDTRALFELKLFDEVKKDEDSVLLDNKDEEISFRRLGNHVYGYTFLDVL